MVGYEMCLGLRCVYFLDRFGAELCLVLSCFGSELCLVLDCVLICHVFGFEMC